MQQQQIQRLCGKCSSRIAVYPGVLEVQILTRFNEFDVKASIEIRTIGVFFQGQGSFRTHLTLPNILKEFNPKLFGYVDDNATHINECSSIVTAF